jgi:hypothetical protein
MYTSTYQSRRQRNPPSKDEQLNRTPFFSKSIQNGIQKKKEQPFFQVSGNSMNFGKRAIQRMGADPEKDKMMGLQKKEEPLKEEEKKNSATPVQAKQDGSSNTASPQVSAMIENNSGKGSVLPSKTLKEMNASFGTDFSHVRIHRDPDSENLSEALHAQAFTHGNDIYFNKGKYNPDGSEGKSLLAHELTHVVQQGAGIHEKKIQQKVFPQNVTTNDTITATVGKSRQEIIDAIADADADAIVLAQNAEDVMTAQLANAIAKSPVDPDAELILNEELGLSYNNTAHHGLIRQQIFRFRRVRETLQSGYLRYLALGINNVDLIGCSTGNCGPNFAFSCPGNRLIVLCQAFWDNPDQQSATVLHEPFHIWFHMAFHAATALRRADATCFESFALRSSGRSAFASCDTHTAG